MREVQHPNPNPYQRPFGNYGDVATVLRLHRSTHLRPRDSCLFSLSPLTAVEQMPLAARLRQSGREERDIDRRECMPQEFPIGGSESKYA